MNNYESKWRGIHACMVQVVLEMMSWPYHHHHPGSKIRCCKSKLLTECTKWAPCKSFHHTHNTFKPIRMHKTFQPSITLKIPPKAYLHLLYFSLFSTRDDLFLSERVSAPTAKLVLYGCLPDKLIKHFEHVLFSSFFFFIRHASLLL